MAVSTCLNFKDAGSWLLPPFSSSVQEVGNYGVQIKAITSFYTFHRDITFHDGITGD
ncbi:MAG: hypothetical protein K1V87_09210 [Muribaculum sp.]